MDFDRIELRDFRLYRHLAVEFPTGLNALVGPNASGKTTVLEAMSVLATGHSFRGATDPEMTRNGQGFYRLTGRFAGRQGSHTVEVAFETGAGDAPPRKVTAVDGHPLPRASDLLGRIPLLSFSPDDLSLVKGGPSERRRFLDVLLAQTSPPYRDRLARYQRTLAQRNALLGELMARRTAIAAAATLLEPWDEALTTESSAVQADRAEAVATVAPLAVQAFATIDGRELALNYQSSVFDPGRRQEELRRGVTLSGPHRDELTLAVAGQEARRYASQGQQRSVVLALKLAALEVMERSTGDTPVLLLDDVLSELDPARGAQLLPLLLRGQAFVTATDRSTLARALADMGAHCAGSWFDVGAGLVTQGFGGGDSS